MDNVSFITVTNPLTSEVVEHAIIDRGNGEYTSMPKSTYDEMIAEQANNPAL
jgi:predicted aspartyl protease